MKCVPFLLRQSVEVNRHADRRRTGGNVARDFARAVRDRAGIPHDAFDQIHAVRPSSVKVFRLRLHSGRNRLMHRLLENRLVTLVRGT